MKYTLDSGKCVTIPDKEIEKSMKSLELSKEEAIQLWLEDNDYATNEELEELDAKAKKVKIDHGATSAERKKATKPKTVKISDEKQALFQNIKAFVSENYENCTVLTENKLLSVQIGDKIFKIDIIQQRNAKK